MTAVDRNLQCDIANFLAHHADEARLLSDKYCTGGYVRRDGCGWYHSVWEYLRLIDMVSTPDWHKDFFVNSIYSILEADTNRVLVSGAADFTMLAYIIHIAEVKALRPQIDVVDLCQTPLELCKLYSVEKGLRVNTIQTDILATNISTNKYDLICTDAFLTRFTLREAEEILHKWYAALRKNGSIITTVRIHTDDRDSSNPLLISDFVSRAVEQFNVIGTCSKITQKQFEEMVGVYATKMRSENLGNADDIISMFVRVGLKVIATEVRAVKGELSPANYLEIHSIKEEK